MLFSDKAAGGSRGRPADDGERNEKAMRGKQLVIGILAHVDAGKTTLSEAMLYLGGALRKLGRVDHGDAFLDHFSMERARGITIFSKQARVSWKGLDMTLLDTPGHVDFCAEMERTLQVLDYAVLVVSAPDGIQGHTVTLWRLLAQYGIPVFLFVNKMDQPGADREGLLVQLRQRLDPNCMDFGENAERDEAFWEALSLCGERLLEEYLETGSLSEDSLSDAIRRRQVFPCFFGSALRLEGVEGLLEGLRKFTVLPEYPEEFGARVYKISRDAGGNRLTHLKVTGGVLRVKMPVGGARGTGKGRERKVDQIRVYDGAQFLTAEQVEAGGICAVTGLDGTFAGQGLGAEQDSGLPSLAPVLTYRVILPEGSDLLKALGQLRQLEEEDPQLHLVWKEDAREIHVQVMGEIQIEILKSLIRERFGLEAEFGGGRIVYRETIAAPVVGIGHFEPLRHYAEVHLLLEPGEPGSGLQFASACSGDALDRNWQRLILAHLKEKTHAGVLTGSAVTDMKITLLAGRAHLKHTEGGDFRQAAYRALRQGLMQAESVLLEPVFSFAMELPTEQLGRAMSDIRKMHGSFDAPMTEGERSILTGSVPAAEFGSYPQTINAYTRGRGRLTCTLKGYEPCHNAEEVIASIGYDPEADLENPASSVFCAHGAGFLVEWDRVWEYAHVENGCRLRETGGEAPQTGIRIPARPRESGGDYITQEEIEQIFQSTYKKSVKDYEPYRYHKRNAGGAAEAEDRSPGQEAEGADGENRAGRKGNRKRPDAGAGEEYLLVDGYNIIFAWEELRSLAAVNIDSARDRLMEICCDYQGYAGCTLILVFDAYKVKGNPGSSQKYNNIYVVYTREAETADQYIEKTVHKIGRKRRVTVATSDGLEQMIIWGEGAVRLSAAGFLETVEAARADLRERYLAESRVYTTLPVPGLSEGLTAALTGEKPDCRYAADKIKESLEKNGPE